MRISGFFFLSATLKAKRGRTYGTRINIVVFKNYPVHIIKITLKMYNPIFFQYSKRTGFNKLELFHTSYKS